MGGKSVILEWGNGRYIFLLLLIKRIKVIVIQLLPEGKEKKLNSED